MPLLNDGYSWPCELPGGLRAIYRPALKDDRRALLSARSRLGNQWFISALYGHLLEWGNGHPISSEICRMCRNDEAFLLRSAGILLGLSHPNVDTPWSEQWESESAENLRDGVLLERLHPMFAKRDCSACQYWWYNDETGGFIRRTPNGPSLRRPDHVPTLCKTPAGCPKGTPENPRTFKPHNAAALQHYLTCLAIGRFPDDPIVARNAAIIRAAMGQQPTAKQPPSPAREAAHAN